MHKKRPLLKTVEEVIKAFGGVREVQAWMTGSASRPHRLGFSATNWKAWGFIPPAWHWRMEKELQYRGFEVDPRVFGETDPGAYRRALRKYRRRQALRRARCPGR